MDRVWGMKTRMKGSGKEYGYPAMVEGQNVMTSNEARAEIIAKTLKLCYAL